MEKIEKEQLVRLISRWRTRSNLTVRQVVARIQAHGCDISRSMFENRFIRFDQRPDIDPELSLAVIAAFSQGLTLAERCTAKEAISLATLTHLPLDRFPEIGAFFPGEEFAAALGHYLPSEVTPVPPSSRTLPLYLPGKSYQRLVGREQELAQLLAALQEPERKPIVAIVGLGGIGKTTLAQEAAEQAWVAGLFEHLVWISAKTERFVAEGTHPIEVSDLRLERLLDEIGRQCERKELSKMSLPEKRLAVKELLQRRRVMIVLDNLETVAESETLVDEMCKVLGQSKLLLTSRHHVRHERAFVLNLTGLFEADGITFLREDSAERGIRLVAEASKAELYQIFETTGGAPLAMKLVVGQMSRWPLGRVLDNLRAARFEGPNYDFYRFIYKQSWDLLSAEGQKVLVSMAVFDLTNGGNEESLVEISQVGDKAIHIALDQLILLSLIEVRGDLASRRYTLHALTHYFVMSDIVKRWS